MEDPVIIKLLNEVLSANILYAAEFGDKKNLAIPPERHIAILIWMDARLIPDKFAGLSEGGFIDWLTITDQKISVIEGVERIHRHPLVPKDIAIYGYIFDVKSGMLKEVPDATTSGKATKVLYVMTAAGHGSGLTYKW